ncbi:GyrI-like domain-containing protein [Reichenbachiella versicolor]|uniref:GyrI-like domain-containing protein n=1 Tax=Reichenbachiella versicolor TaxID=1821036 RepID=UPI000D6E01A6|nr:GyrI-like domain-containing protein [Reichenbachiella versicolor]
MEKLDLKKTDPNYYRARKKPQVLDFDPHCSLTITGIGAPEEDRFLQSIAAIYPVAYTVKKYCQRDSKDFVVPKLECFWWVDEGLEFSEDTKSDWQWQLMIRMPEYVTHDMVDQAVEEVVKKKGIPYVNEVILKPIHEGKSIQMMHTGSYYQEEETINQLMTYMQLNNLTMNGFHHEIYISDPRKTAEEKLKTIIRYAVK